MKFDYTDVQFRTDGSAHDRAQLDAATALVRRPGVTDVLVLAHGWNNDMDRARRLYVDLTDRLHDVGGTVLADNRRLAVVGVLWPSIRWADDDDIAGGGASVGAGRPERVGESVEDAATATRLEELMPALDGSAAARDEFLALLRGMLPTHDDGADDDPVPETLRSGHTDTVFAAASGPDLELSRVPEQTGGAAAFGPGVPGGAGVGAGAGGAAGFSFGGFRRAARNLLNLTTYYTMRDRSGDVGRTGVAGLLGELAAAKPVTLHLVGHSFGARVMSAAAARHHRVHSLTLLQAAFSHYGFSAKYDSSGAPGAFRAVLDPGRMTGPVIVTHTEKDRAVGIAYAIASRLAGQAGSNLGDANDRFGGLGRNGAQKTDEVVGPGTGLHQVGEAYTFTAGGVHNLKGDPFITSHGTVAVDEVAYAILQAIETPAG
ncbi:alpha/beta fold hydrolase [Virgisporangium ochraceum]|uniref:Serine-threonine protein kinase n=1 Tax=Virgisporangium ochraceum TaxID=65505 RepID=A0A8J4EI45_9ACTN|nr:hypothetical protein [Virgisporangium ochraceum]GIJ75356.1 hypothetical protein Voc01_102730 [Virgisporangium ochraceum]